MDKQNWTNENIELIPIFFIIYIYVKSKWSIFIKQMEKNESCKFFAVIVRWTKQTNINLNILFERLPYTYHI